jgi:hypothetical protein
VIGAASSSPLVKVAAFGYGIRKATKDRRHADEEREVRDRLRVERAERKAARPRRRWRSA